ncbi:Suppressor protein stp22 of temperature-sensitive alpha-factor receptor and arginine permease [Rhinocladiella similis]
MAGVPQKTLSWLYDVLKREYRDPNRTYSDLAYVLSRNPGFAPRTDVYTFENGVSALLVHFKGTIPVNFRGNVYRFPVSLWVPHTYPYEPPMCYVTPTDDMAIRPGQYVGGDGKVYHPYLAHWPEAWERSNLVDFLSILADVFAKEPPVVAKGQLQQRPAQPTPPPVPPLPRELAQHPSPLPVSSPPLQTQHQHQGGPPPPPPKPSAHPASQSPSGSPGQRLSRYDAPPPLPPHQQSPGQRPQHTYGNGDVPRSPTGMNYMPQRTSSLRQSMLPQQQPQQQQQQPQYRAQPPRPGEGQQYAQQPGPMSPPPAQTYDPRSQPNQYHPQPLQQGQAQYAGGQQYPPGQGPPPPASQPHPQYQGQPYPPQQQHPQPQPPPSQPKPAPPPDLLDSPFEISLPSATNATSHPNSSNIPAPPIPVNPEKEALLTHLSHTLTQSLHSQIAQSTSALPALQSQNAALQSTVSTLSAELTNLQTLHSTLSSNLSLLSTSLSKSDGVISSARQRASQNDIPAVDDMLVPPTVVARQLYDAACEERGIEDAILALQEGFVRGRVGPDVWSRKTRELAREGFRRRWMERKVARGMGLDLSHYGSIE